MKLIAKLYVAFAVLLVIGLASVVLTIVSVRQSTFSLERADFAHQQYVGYLSLSNHAYQLFKQFGDAMLVGDGDAGAGETDLIARIRDDIEELRTLTAREIQFVGSHEKAEIEELHRLAEIERQVDLLIQEYAVLLRTSEAADFPTDWRRLSHVLEEKIDRDFNALIQSALDDEAEEVAEARGETVDLLAAIDIAAFGFAVIAIAAAAASVQVLVRDIRGPIDRLITGARALATGHLDHRIEASGYGELDDVGRAFNSMAAEIASREAVLAGSKVELEQAVADRTAELQRVLERLKTNETNRRRLLADVSHELRTPLTIIQGEAEIALRGAPKSPERYREALEKTRDAARHTARLVDDLLFVARREAGEPRLSMGDVDLGALIPAIIEECRFLKDGDGREIAFHNDVGAAVVRGDRDRIWQVVVILVENALHYGGERVSVRLNAAPSGYAILVADDGPGMSEEDQARAFDRFFRGANAAARYTRGAGLGLPVAKAIVEAHGGTIALRSEPGEGTAVSVLLPTRLPLRAIS